VRLLIRIVAIALCASFVAYIVVTTLPSLSSDQLFVPAPVPSPPPAMPFTDVDPYGANFFLEWEPEEWKIDKTFELASNAGIHWVKQDFPWESLQLSPGSNGYWDQRLNQSTWDKYDRIVRLAHKYNLEIIARLDRPPAWTRADNRHPERPPDDPNTYGAFVYDVVSHFKGQIHYYQIWNEPNIYPEWGEQAPSASGYVRLLKTAYQRAKQADPNVVILSAPLAQTLETSVRNESDLQYLEEMYTAGARPYFDILFANAYGFAFPPEDPPNADRLNFQRVVLLRRIMEANGDSGKPVWFNEFGWDAAPDSFAANDLPWGRVTDQQQAQYTVDAVRFARANWNWAGVFNIWYFRENGNIPEDRADHYFRMVDEGFTPRPLYNLVKQATENVGSAGPGVYAVTDPAAEFSGSWSPALTPAGIGGVIEATTATGDSLTIAFRGGGISLHLQSRPNAGQVFITVDGREANRIGERVQGRSVVNLSGSDHDDPAVVPVSDGLGPGQHVLRLVVGPAAASEHGAVDIAGFEVRSIDRFAALTGAALEIGAAVVAAGAIYLIARSWPSRR
jgi:hypothetical protein